MPVNAVDFSRLTEKFYCALRTRFGSFGLTYTCIGWFTKFLFLTSTPCLWKIFPQLFLAKSLCNLFVNWRGASNNYAIVSNNRFLKRSVYVCVCMWCLIPLKLSNLTPIIPLLLELDEKHCASNKGPREAFLEWILDTTVIIKNKHVGYRMLNVV